MACVLKPTEMIRVRSATDCRSDSGDPGYSSETQWSAEMQKLLVEFRTLYHERLRQIDQSDDCREETLQSKVGVLQSFVRELSEQNEVLIQALEAEKVEGSAVEGRAASMQKELEELKLNMREEKLPELQSNAFRKRRPALALCPMPVDFVGTNETVFLRTAGHQTGWCEYVQTQLPTQDASLQQLNKACLSQQEAQAEVEDREVYVQKLQDTITELHKEMTRMDQDKLSQLQELHQLQTRVKLLSDQVSSTEQTDSRPVPHLTEQRSRELMKIELSRRDTTVQRLRQDLLLSHQARDSQTAQLDIQEQRISQLQTELHKSQLELQLGHGRREQQNRDLQNHTQQTEELRTQLAEVKGRLVQVEEENETLTGDKREQESKVERLAAEVDSLQREAGGARAHEGTGSTQAERRWVDCEVELAETRSQLAVCQDRLHISTRTLQDRSAELQRLQRSMVLLHEREMEWAREKSALQSQLSCAREELHSAPLRVRMSEVLLQDQEVLVAQRLLEERGPQDGEQLEWKERPHTVSDQPRLTAAELKEEHRAKGSALRSLILQEEDTHRLAAQNQELQHSLEELHDRDGQQVAVCFLRAELQRWQSEARAQQESREEEVSTLRADLKEAQGRHRHCRATREHLLSDLEQARRQAGQAEKEASDRERCLRGLEAELSRLRSVLQEAESGGVDTEALTQSLDLYRTKYQACLTKISQQNSILQAKDEDLKETRAQVTEQEEQVVCLRAQVAVLQGELRACSAQLDSGDDALDTLSRRLRDTQRDLDDSHKHSQECELVIRTLRDTTATLRRQVEEHEESVVKIQADFCDYKATHIHSDSDYNSQLSRIEELQQASSQAVEQCAQGTQELSACQSEVDQLREEVSRLAQLNANSLTEVLQLQEAGRQLQAEAMIEEQRRLQEVGALEQNAARLEQEVQAAHSRCAQRQQAVQKRDSLLRRSEADLLEAREALRSRALEVEKQAAVVRGLEADLQRARREGQQKDQECVSLRTQLMTVMEELKKTQGRYRDTAQELARQEEKVVLVEGAQQRAQGHLAERVAELERAEQNQRSQRAEIRTLKKRLHTTERELQGSRARVEVLEKETEEGRQAQIKAQQEASTHQQVVEQLEAELTSTKDTIRTLQQQLKEQERTVEVLQEQLAEVQSATWRIQEEHTACQSQLHQCKMELETREETREDQSLKQSQEVRSCEGRLAELCVQLEWSQHRCQEQLVALEAKEEMMLVMKVEMSSLRENLHAKMAQVDDLHSQLHSMEDIYTTAANEVEVLRRSLESSRSDVCHLTRESDLVVTNISQWVKMQRQGNDKFNLLIKDQRKKIIRLAAENDHLQECVDGLQRQVERLTAELVESRMEESQICSGCGRGLK